MRNIVGLMTACSVCMMSHIVVYAAPETGWTCPTGICTVYEQCSGHGTCMGEAVPAVQRDVMASRKLAEDIIKDVKMDF